MLSDKFYHQMVKHFFDVFGKALMPDWVMGQSIVKDRKYEPHHAILTDALRDYRREGLEAFLLLGTCLADEFYCLNTQWGAARITFADFTLTTLSRTGIKASNAHVLDKPRFYQHLAHFAEECSRYFNAGNAQTFDKLLDLFSMRIAQEIAPSHIQTLSENAALDLMTSLYSALAEYHVSPTPWDDIANEKLLVLLKQAFKR